MPDIIISQPGIQTQQSLRSNDYLGFTQGAYLFDDLLGNTPIAISTTGTGAAGYGIVTPGGVPGFPAGFAAADIKSQPGVGYVSCQALNDVGSFMSSGTGASTAYLTVVPGATYQSVFSLEVLTPTALSSATDRYQLYVGWAFITNAGPVHGWTIGYSDNVNSGSWVVQEWVSSVASTIANSSAAVLARTWYRFLLTVTGNSITVTATQANGTIQVLASAIVSPQLNAGNPLPSVLFGAYIKRAVFTAGTLGMLVDSASYQAINPART